MKCYFFSINIYNFQKDKNNGHKDLKMTGVYVK